MTSNPRTDKLSVKLININDVEQLINRFTLTRTVNYSSENDEKCK